MFKIVFCLFCLWNWGPKGNSRVLAGNESIIALPYRFDSYAQGRSQNRNLLDFNQSTNTYSCLVALLPTDIGLPTISRHNGEPVLHLHPYVPWTSFGQWKESFQNRSLSAEAPLSIPDCPLPGDFSTVTWDTVASYGIQCKSHCEILIHSDRRVVPRFIWT